MIHRYGYIIWKSEEGGTVQKIQKLIPEVANRDS